MFFALIKGPKAQKKYEEFCVGAWLITLSGLDSVWKGYIRTYPNKSVHGEALFLAGKCLFSCFF